MSVRDLARLKTLTRPARPAPDAELEPASSAHALASSPPEPAADANDRTEGDELADRAQTAGESKTNGGGRPVMEQRTRRDLDPILARAVEGVPRVSRYAPHRSSSSRGVDADDAGGVGAAPRDVGLDRGEASSHGRWWGRPLVWGAAGVVAIVGAVVLRSRGGAASFSDATPRHPVDPLGGTDVLEI